MSVNVWRAVAIGAVLTAAFFAWKWWDSSNRLHPESETLESQERDVIADAAVQLVMTNYLYPRPVLSYQLTGRCSAVPQRIEIGGQVQPPTYRWWSVYCPTEKGDIGFDVSIESEPDDALKSLAAIIPHSADPVTAQYVANHEYEWEVWRCGDTLVEQGAEGLRGQIEAGEGPCAQLGKSTLTDIALSFGLPPPKGYWSVP
jgi:hypothetical protein